jgi:hypothetical protein
MATTRAQGSRRDHPLGDAGVTLSFGGHEVTRPPRAQLAQVALATLLVAGVPVAIVWSLRASGTVSSAIVGMVLGMALSLGASWIGCLVWEHRPGSQDLLFSELMVWGFVHRWHTQRRLASARDLLGGMSEAQRRLLDGLGVKEQAKLLERLVGGMETRDPYLHGHSRRVARHSWMIARRMGLPRAQVARVRTAAAIHDVGKIKTPKAILHKAGPLTDEEYEVIKRHPGDGARMVAVLRDQELTAMVRHHHERLDGTGYPDRLSGDEIPLGARIIAVADTFDAITSARPYRPASAHKKAIDILRGEAGARLDPVVVKAFCSHYAGRGPVALSSALAGLPERALSWLSGSVAGFASAAKVAAVAALVGGAAAVTSTIAVPLPKPNSTKAQVGSTSARAPATNAAPAGASSANGATALVPRAPGTSGRRRSLHPPSVHRRVPAPLPASSSAGSTETRILPPVNAGSGSGHTTGPGGGESPARGKHEESGGKTEEAGAKSKPEENPAKGKPKESPAKGKPEESPGKGKSEEAPGRGKAEESSGKGKSEEGSGKNKPEERPAKSAEGTSKGASGEGHAKAEESASKGKVGG